MVIMNSDKVKAVNKTRFCGCFSGVFLTGQSRGWSIRAYNLIGDFVPSQGNDRLGRRKRREKLK